MRGTRRAAAKHAGEGESTGEAVDGLDECDVRDISPEPVAATLGTITQTPRSGCRGRVDQNRVWLGEAARRATTMSSVAITKYGLAKTSPQAVP